MITSIFQSTHPVWDGTQPPVVPLARRLISIHPSRVGWDAEATTCGKRRRISIHPSRVGWDFEDMDKADDDFISIHPSRVGWDHTISLGSPQASNFNPPIPCGMGLTRPRSGSSRDVFQSTHPVWDGTVYTDLAQIHVAISIHPSRVGWDFVGVDDRMERKISIHPSRVGWDYTSQGHHNRGHKFQSTHPVWDGTPHQSRAIRTPGISIHPSRVGWDLRIAENAV